MEMLSGFHLVFLDVGGGGGTVQLNPDDIGLDTSGYPAGVITLGRKTVVDPDLFKKFASCRKALQRAAIVNGTRFKAGVYAVSDDKLPIFQETVSKIEVEYQAARESLRASFDQKVREWAAKADLDFPGWGDKILNNAPTADQVAAKLQWGVTIMTAGLPRVAEVSDGNLGATLSGLPAQISKEISQDAKTWEDPGEANLTAGNVRTRFARFKDKMVSLSFLDASGKLTRVAEMIDSVMNTIPSTGKLEGAHYFMARGMMEFLSDPAKMMSDRHLSVTDLYTEPPKSVEAVLAAESVSPEPEPSEIASLAW